MSTLRSPCERRTSPASCAPALDGRPTPGLNGATWEVPSVADTAPPVHPYIPNSAPEVRAAMLRAIGVSDVEELFRDIPPDLRLQGRLDIPRALLGERELKRHVA